MTGRVSTPPSDPEWIAPCTVNKLLETLRAFGMLRLIALAGVAIGVLAAFLMLELHGVNTSRMTLLVSDLDPHSLQQAIEELDRRKIPYRMEETGGQIFVPDSQVTTDRKSTRLNSSHVEI